MSQQGRGADEERRLRGAAAMAAGQQPEESAEDPELTAARARRVEHQARWVDFQVKQAMRRGDFDDLPGAGKPIRGLSGTHDPEWWVKSLIEREQLTGIGPPALALRKEDAELEARIDRESTEQAVRDVVEDFNRRVVEARRQLLGGPPVITPTRDVNHEIAAWRSRRVQRRDRLRRRRPAPAPAPPLVALGWRRRWWARGQGS